MRYVAGLLTGVWLVVLGIATWLHFPDSMGWIIPAAMVPVAANILTWWEE